MTHKVYGVQWGIVHTCMTAPFESRTTALVHQSDYFFSLPLSRLRSSDHNEFHALDFAFSGDDPLCGDILCGEDEACRDKEGRLGGSRIPPEGFVGEASTRVCFDCCCVTCPP